MHDVAEGKLDILARLTMIFSCIDEIETMELNNAETNLPENHQDNCAPPLAKTQPSLPHSPPADTLAASILPPPRPRVGAGDAAL